MKKNVFPLRINNGSAVPDNKKEGVFCMFYTKESSPHLNNKEIENPNLKYPEFLMLLNWRGGFGFPGGTVDKDEISEYGTSGARLVALKRELKEEINFDIDPKKISDIICTHNLGGTTAHLYAYEVSQKEIEDIRDDVKNATHSRSEIIGVNFIPCVTHKKGYGLPLFLQHKLIFAVREEIIVALKELKLMTEDELREICKKADFDYDELIK